MRIHAWAKVNLVLEVLGRRPDGFHEIASVIQAIDLHDTLTFERSEQPHLTLSGGAESLAGGDNLVLRAARLLQSETGCRLGARISLIKRIPVAAGLGGGSSDAAATLRALNELWHLRLSTEQLIRLATLLGSDVPFFLGSSTARSEGQGERLTPLPPLPPTWLVLLRPLIAVSTRDVYHHVTLADCTDGSRARGLASYDRSQLDWVKWLFNGLEQVTCRLHPMAAAAREMLHGASGAPTLMSGSGPTFFAVVPSEAAARRVLARATGQGYAVYVATFVSSAGACTGR